MSRSIRAVHDSFRDDIGDLVTRRPLPGPHVAQIDPFLFLNHHGPQTYAPNNRGLPFGPHPHRGFETVTFILDGELGHYDSGGHESVIRAGGVQWMTAGSGLIHAELSPPSFKRDGGPTEILQLWVNLPAKHKFAKPAYVGLQREDIPALDTGDGGATLNLIAGELGAAVGPVETLSGHFMSTIEADAGARVVVRAPSTRNVFFYIVRGCVRIAGDEITQWKLVEFNDDGEEIAFHALDDSFILFGYGEPINEPVVAHGPFVMNTREEIVAAIQDYQAGKFGPPAAVA
ncbi:MAG TPA: pirin family protein [Vitreimonas sp.]|uniref:pirin family protein n=1 Tax=Vitreimonas sp. TaxID=3069702 RepID=UPI002D56C623|nr:pirin family protein [Vitreimonas sp.]HYD87816.1 pirin family protein [Vitreimonas sp.]